MGSPRNSDKAAVLRRGISDAPVVRAVGAGDALTAVLAERAGFEAIWASGLAISASHVVPDASILTMTEFLSAARAMNDACSLPVIADCDTGFGDINNVVRMVQQYEGAGVAAVCIEDKEYPKRNSFSGGNQRLSTVDEFSAKVRAAKSAQSDPDFIVIARLESLIVGAGVSDALRRADAYAAAGADAILIHSKSRDPAEILEFAESWRGQGSRAPLVAVPTTYHSVTAAELAEAGVRVVIYANQALRSSVRAINETLASIAATGSSAEVEERITPVPEILELIGTDGLVHHDPRFEPEQLLPLRETTSSPADS